MGDLESPLSITEGRCRSSTTRASAQKLSKKRIKNPGASNEVPGFEAPTGLAKPPHTKRIKAQ
jgi:hypothetical protein